MSFMSYRDYLSKLYAKLKKDAPTITHKDFSELLGFSRDNNTVRLVISGHRILSRSSAEIVVKSSGIKGQKKKYFLLMVDFNNERIPKKREDLFEQLLSLKKSSNPKRLNDKQMQYFSQWYHPVIRELMAIRDQEADPEKIQERLQFPLRLDQIKKSLQLLESIGLIEFDNTEQRFKRSGEVVGTDEIVDSLAVTQYHQKMIEMGKDSITRIHESIRTINSVTISIPVSAVPTLNEKIDKFLDEVLRVEDELDDHSDVFQVNVQMFPFTKPRKD